MTLDHFLLPKEIVIDAAGWSDLLLGVVIGSLKPPDRRYMERRIPTASFQPPNFKNKRYLQDAVKIADEIIAVMRPDEETHFKVSTAYVLSSVRLHLQELGFKVEKTEFTGELHQMVERGYVRWCIEVGVPEEVVNSKKRFWAMLRWVAEKPRLRESLVKTGWASWEQKWRQEMFKPIDLPGQEG